MYCDNWQYSIRCPFRVSCCCIDRFLNNRIIYWHKGEEHCLFTIYFQTHNGQFLYALSDHNFRRICKYLSHWIPKLELIMEIAIEGIVIDHYYRLVPKKTISDMNTWTNISVLVHHNYHTRVLYYVVCRNNVDTFFGTRTQQRVMHLTLNVYFCRKKLHLNHCA
jgi:hypothetical protein